VIEQSSTADLAGRIGELLSPIPFGVKVSLAVGAAVVVILLLVRRAGRSCLLTGMEAFSTYLFVGVALYAICLLARTNPVFTVIVAASGLAGALYLVVRRKRGWPAAWGLLILAPAFAYVAVVGGRQAVTTVVNEPVSLALGVIIMAGSVLLIQWLNRLHKELRGKQLVDGRTDGRERTRQLLPGLFGLAAIIAVLAFYRYIKTFISLMSAAGLQGSIVSFVVVYAILVAVFGLVFASIYVKDRKAIIAEREPGLVDFIYFSFQTMTTSGDGSMRPASNIAKLASMVEVALAFVGVSIYLGAVLSHYAIGD